LSYARTENRNTPRVWAGIAILFAGVALIVIAGCFLIGVMLTENIGGSGGPSQPAPPLAPGVVLFITVLYVLAAGALIGGILVIITGLRSLLHTIRN
jgi:hypothetical protein